MSLAQYTLTLFLLLSYTFCQAQETADTTFIPLTAYWKKGDAYNFRITKLKQKWKEDKVTKNDSFSYVANFEVLDSTTDGYTIQWTCKSDFSQFVLEEGVQDKMAGLFPSEIIYTTTEHGEFVEVVNWKQIMTAMKKMSKQVIKELNKQHREDKKLQMMVKTILSGLQTRAGIEQLLLEELYLFHFPLGYEYAVGDTLSYEEELPSNLESIMVTGQTKLYLSEVKQEDYYCVLMEETQANPEETKKAMVEAYRSLGMESKAFEKAMETAVVENNHHNIYQYFYEPGIPYHINAQREFYIQIDGEEGGNLSITRIELLFDED